MSGITSDPRAVEAVRAHPYPLLFATVSGAHLYGFASPDSDVDLRGAHVLPVAEVIGLDPGPETVERSYVLDGLDIDLVTHDVRKFATLLLKRNGYVLEQLLSPLVITATPAFEALRDLAPGCLTRHHAHHYLGFAATQWDLYAKESPPRVKPLLYVYRVLLTGIHLMRTGEVVADLERLLAGRPHFADIASLVQAKRSGSERLTVAGKDRDQHTRRYADLRRELERAFEASTLPDRPSARRAIDDVIIRARLEPDFVGSPA